MPPVSPKLLKMAELPGVGKLLGGAFGMNRLRKKFIPAETAAEAVEVAIDLCDQGFRAGLYHLCDDVTDSNTIGDSRAQSIEAMKLLNEAGLDIVVYKGVRQLGFGAFKDVAKRNLVAVADRLMREAGDQTANYETRLTLSRKRNEVDPEALGPRRHHLVLEAEDMGVIRGLLGLHGYLARNAVSVVASVYAAMVESETDLMALIAGRADIRLCLTTLEYKDAEVYDEDTIPGNYEVLIETLLSEEAAINGVYPIFHVTDLEWAELIKENIDQDDWEPGSYEFEVPYGLGNGLAESLRDEGHRVRIVVPFGREWLGYAERYLVT